MYKLMKMGEVDRSFFLLGFSPPNPCEVVINFSWSQPVYTYFLKKGKQKKKYEQLIPVLSPVGNYIGYSKFEHLSLCAFTYIIF